MSAHSDLVAKVRRASAAAQLDRMIRGLEPNPDAVAKAAVDAVAEWITEGK